MLFSTAIFYSILFVASDLWVTAHMGAFRAHVASPLNNLYTTQSQRNTVSNGDQYFKIYRTDKCSAATLIERSNGEILSNIIHTYAHANSTYTHRHTQANNHDCKLPNYTTTVLNNRRRTDCVRSQSWLSTGKKDQQITTIKSKWK